MITDPTEYFAKGCGRCGRFETSDCSALIWAEGLALIRDICRNAGLSETAKWGHPCYMHAGRDVAIIGAFRDDFRLSFFEAGLMQDQSGILQRQGPNSATTDTISFTGADQVTERAAILRAYLAEAKGYAEAGQRAPRPAQTVQMPEELIEALAADPELSAAFDALTPGRQRSYAFNLSQAKKPETRIARIAKFRGKILDGKGAMER